MSLTDLEVRRAKSGEKPYKLADAEGMHLLVHPRGTKYWRLKYRFAGKEKQLALGVYPEISLADARQRRVEARRLISEGHDPMQAKQTAKRLALFKNATTFEAVAREWHEGNLHTWNPKHGANVLKRLEAYIFPKLGSRPITDVSTPELLAVLRLLEERGTLDLTRAIAQYCSRVFSYAVASGRCDRNPALDLRGALKTPVSNHHAYLKAEDMPEFLERLEAYDGSLQTKLALKMLLLTFVRTTELRGAEWSEIDWLKSEWRIPAPRMKMKDPHIVPLCTQAVATLKDVQKISGNRVHIFPNEKRPITFMSENTMLYALYRMGYHSRATGHGFRATASTILNESGFVPDVIERQLAHKERNKVRAAYNHAQYLAERRKMMQWWGDYLQKIGMAHANK